MFDMSWSELLLIAVVALMVIGPKDLPKLVKTLAQLARKARAMAREFQSGVEDMAREAELHELKKELDDTVSTDLSHELEQSIDPGGTVAKSLDLQAESAASVAAPALPAPAAEAAEGVAVAAPAAGEPAHASVAPSPAPSAAPALAPAPVERVEVAAAASALPAAKS